MQICWTNTQMQVARQPCLASRAATCPPSCRRRGRGALLRNRAAAAEKEVELLDATADAPSTSRARLVGFEDGVYTVEGAFSTPASTGQVWDVLTDYERLADIFTNIKSSRMLSREPEIVLYQDCKWEFLIFSGKFGTELSVKEDWHALGLKFELIESSFMRSFVGEWKLEAHEGGTQIRHRLTVEPLVSPPAFMNNYTQKIFVQQVALILRDLEEEMERQGSHDFSHYDL